MGAVLPNMAKQDGSCVHLNDKSQCDIYDTRPSFCRVVFKEDGRFKNGQEYFEANIEACKIFIDEDGLGDEFYPKLQPIVNSAMRQPPHH